MCFLLVLLPYFRHLVKGHLSLLAMAFTARVTIAFYFLAASADYRLYQPPNSPFTIQKSSLCLFHLTPLVQLLPTLTPILSVRCSLLRMGNNSNV